MATPKPAPISAAEQYADLLEKQFETWLESSFSSQSLKGVSLFEHTVPSGMKFKVRNLSPEFLVQSNAMPLGLAEHVLTEADDPEAEKKREEEAFEALPPREQLRRLQLVAKQIQFICVEPRVLAGPVNGHKNAISISQLSGADFGSLAMRSKGGDSAPGLKTFRSKRR